jgi:hypothetical protein
VIVFRKVCGDVSRALPVSQKKHTKSWGIESQHYALTQSGISVGIRVPPWQDYPSFPDSGAPYVYVRIMQCDISILAEIEQ